jgi:hypothetical protein
MGAMSIVEEIYSAADRRGLSLTDYIRHTYKGHQLTALELNIKMQLESLRADISDFMAEAESDYQAIDANLLCADKEKLDLMQERIRENLKRKREQLESMNLANVSILRMSECSAEG